MAGCGVKHRADTRVGWFCVNLILSPFHSTPSGGCGPKPGCLALEGEAISWDSCQDLSCARRCWSWDPRFRFRVRVPSCSLRNEAHPLSSNPSFQGCGKGTSHKIWWGDCVTGTGLILRGPSRVSSGPRELAGAECLPHKQEDLSSKPHIPCNNG